jgi:trehalose 6-phosphate phosphatase
VPVPAPLSRLVAHPDRSGLFLDFDGSLAPIGPDPETTRPLPHARDAVVHLASRLARVGIISGRPVEFLVAAIDSDALDYFGLYGMERLVGGRVVAHPEVAPYAGAVAAAAREARVQLPGLRVEDKRLSVTIHWREAPQLAASGERVARELAAKHGLAVWPSKMASELRPPVSIDKGTALREASAGLEVVAFAGDDHGDLAAFDAIGERGVRIGVRSVEAPAELLERADVVVDGPEGLAGLLDALAAAIG